MVTDLDTQYKFSYIQSDESLMMNRKFWEQQLLHYASLRCQGMFQKK